MQNTANRAPVVRQDNKLPIHIEPFPLPARIVNSAILGLARGVKKTAAPLIGTAAVLGFSQVGMASGDFARFMATMSGAFLALNILDKAYGGWKVQRSYNKYAPLMADLHNLALTTPELLDRTIMVNRKGTAVPQFIPLKTFVDAFKKDPLTAFPDEYASLVALRNEAISDMVSNAQQGFSK